MDDGPGISKNAILVLSVIALGGLVALTLLVGGGGDTAGTSGSSVEGSITTVEPNRLVLRTERPIDGKRDVEFTVRPENAAALDLPHLETHVTDNLPVTLYFEREDDRLYAVRAEDAPAPGG